MEPSVFNPQVWDHPALTEEKEPAGGEDRPPPSYPQQAMEPSVFNPQVCWDWDPALTEEKEPAGGED